MSRDRSLRSHGGMAKARSVLTRSERIERLVDEEKFDMSASNPLGLVKTKVRHSKAGTKAKKEEKAAEGEAAAAGAPAAAAPAAAKPEAKAAAPAKGKK